MIAQYRVELRRLLHRQVLFVFAIFAAIVLVLVGIGIWAASGPEEQYFGASGYTTDTGEYVPGEQPDFGTLDETFCPTGLVTSDRPSSGTEDPFLYDSGSCPETTPSSIERHEALEDIPAIYSPWNGSIAFFTVATLALLWLLGASLIGEEFRHGTVETALVAEPRRARLLTVRFAAVITVGVGIYLVAVGGFLLANVPAWVTRGIGGASVSTVAILASIGRGALAAVLVVALSGALAVIGRGTLLSLGVLVGLAVLAGVFFLFLHPLVPGEFFTNLFGLVTGGDGIRVYTTRSMYYDGPGVTMTVNGAGWPWGATVAVVGGYTVAALTGAYALFTRRDIH